ncbi:uncharacterized protein ARMOST_16033 [Armillaria ostoyae]|uniref:Uncharacterized protein n=1 Tax=Armillaria ostoyae TaxID=47428 RepID=A0A284RV65_ARMOS|nr:uncharacterized protein ARMOST_16033 [Armillaria ostoyae]
MGSTGVAFMSYNVSFSTVASTSHISKSNSNTCLNIVLYAIIDAELHSGASCAHTPCCMASEQACSQESKATSQGPPGVDNQYCDPKTSYPGWARIQYAPFRVADTENCMFKIMFIVIPQDEAPF